MAHEPKLISKHYTWDNTNHWRIYEKGNLHGQLFLNEWNTGVVQRVTQQINTNGSDKHLSAWPTEMCYENYVKSIKPSIQQEMYKITTHTLLAWPTETCGKNKWEVENHKNNAIYSIKNREIWKYSWKPNTSRPDQPRCAKKFELAKLSCSIK